MSTQNIVDKHNLSTNRAIAEYFAKESMDILKLRRFDTGCVDTSNHRLMLYLYRYSCNDWCNIEEEQRSSVREEVIGKTIKSISEL